MTKILKKTFPQKKRNTRNGKFAHTAWVYLQGLDVPER